MNEREKIKRVSPTQEQVSSLVDLYHKGQISEAEKLALFLTQEYPAHPFPWKVLGALLKQVGRTAEAVAVMQTSVELAPQDAEAHSNLGATLQELGRLEEAEASLKQAIVLKPDYAEAYSNLGITLTELGRLEEALKSYKQVIELKPEQAKFHNKMGKTLKELGRFEEAEASFTNAIVLKPDYAEAHINLGITLKKLGKLEAAVASYAQAIELKPDYAEAHNNLGNALKELGSIEEAAASYAQATASKPDYAVAHSNLGIMLKDLDRLEEAEASFRKALTLNPDFAVVRYNLGLTLEKMGRLEEAVSSYDLVKNRRASAQSLQCLYMNQNYPEFDKRLESIGKVDQTNIKVAALSAFSAHQRKKKDLYPFCTNPLDFIVIKNLGDFNSYSRSLIDELLREASNFKLSWESRTTKFGFQGQPDVFENPDNAVANLESIIFEAVDEYYQRFKFETNAFIKLWPEKSKLVGWYNRLVKNGHQTSHIHNSSWLSGVAYLKTVDSLSNDDGAIEFSLHGYDLPIIDENYPKKIHRPKRGDIVLFPSSLFHRTIPFSQDVDRCVIAFDLMPT